MNHISSLRLRSMRGTRSEDHMKLIFHTWAVKVQIAARWYKYYFDSTMNVRRTIGWSLELWVIEELTFQYGIFDRLSCLPRDCLWDADIAYDYEEEIMDLHRAILEMVEIGIIKLDGDVKIIPTAELQPYD